MSEAGKQDSLGAINFSNQTARGWLVFLVFGFTIGLAYCFLVGDVSEYAVRPARLIAVLLSGIGLAVAVTGIGVIRVLERIEAKLGQKD